MKKIFILLLFVVNLAVGQSVVISPNSLSRTAGVSNDISILKYSDDYPTILGIRSGGTAASPTNSTNAMRLLAINAAGKETGSTYIQSNINFFTTENWTNTNRGTKITFGTTANGTTTLSEKMVINHDGKVGIGITVPAEQLHVVGNIRSSSLAGTGNREVYADANGTLTTTPNVAFAAYDIGATNLLVPNTFWKTVPFTEEEYDLNNNYNPTTGIFTAPSNGIYHFDAFVLWVQPSISTGEYNMNIYVNGIYYIQVVTPIQSGKASSLELGTDLKLNVGDEVYIQVYQNSGVNQYIFSVDKFTRFTGHLVIKL